ncbi:hypothetical protein MMC25_004447 [Agyrium rufum]|nr:hypothetical protein [Agyrium rufum]
MNLGDERTHQTYKTADDGSIVKDGDRSITATPPLSTQQSLTPPSSLQVPHLQRHQQQKFQARPSHSQADTPPPTVRMPRSDMDGLWASNVPSQEDVQEMTEGQLRDLVLHLIPALGEARLSFAHAKLQHSLLSIETSEAAQRAAVEEEISRREVEVLQHGSPRQKRNIGRPTWTDPGKSEFMSRQLALAIDHNHRLEVAKAGLEERVKRYKRLVKHLAAKNEELEEDKTLLRERIKQNRDHLQSGAFSSPLSRPAPLLSGQKPTGARTGIRVGPRPRAGSQGAFDALLFAGQVLNGETTSVPSTPTHSRAPRFQPGHTRASQSLSSLPVTPPRAKNSLLPHELLQTPINRLLPPANPSFSAPDIARQKLASSQREEELERHRREERDSTISASEDEEALNDVDDIPASQASLSASNMLRNSGGPTHTSHGLPTPGSTQTSNKMATPSRFADKLSKARGDDPALYHHHRRMQSESSVEYRDEDTRVRKRAKLGNPALDRTDYGLGIGMWPSPS